MNQSSYKKSVGCLMYSECVCESRTQWWVRGWLELMKPAGEPAKCFQWKTWISPVVHGDWHLDRGWLLCSYRTQTHTLASPSCADGAQQQQDQTDTEALDKKKHLRMQTHKPTHQSLCLRAPAPEATVTWWHCSKSAGKNSPASQRWRKSVCLQKQTHN